MRALELKYMIRRTAKQYLTSKGRLENPEPIATLNIFVSNIHVNKAGHNNDRKDIQVNKLWCINQQE